MNGSMFTGTSLASAMFTRGAATRDSHPPCGGGMGWGVVQYGTAVRHRATPIPSPQGGGEEFAAPANHILSLLAKGPARTSSPFKKTAAHHG
jgi:hypothetical protein